MKNKSAYRWPGPGDWRRTGDRMQPCRTIQQKLRNVKRKWRNFVICTRAKSKWINLITCGAFGAAAHVTEKRLQLSSTAPWFRLRFSPSPSAIIFAVLANIIKPAFDLREKSLMWKCLYIKSTKGATTSNKTSPPYSSFGTMLRIWLHNLLNAFLCLTLPLCHALAEIIYIYSCYTYSKWKFIAFLRRHIRVCMLNGD